jgi:hypothetical protein
VHGRRRPPVAQLFSLRCYGDDQQGVWGQVAVGPAREAGHELHGNKQRHLEVGRRSEVIVNGDPEGQLQSTGSRDFQPHLVNVFSAAGSFLVLADVLSIEW